MFVLILGLVVFLGVHLLTRARGVRAGLVQRFGEGGYKAGYSVAALAGLALTVYGYAHAPLVAVWSPPAWTRHIPITLMWPAFILLVASHLAGHIRAKTRHPMLAAVKLWAAAHLAANGDLAGILLFGSFLAYGVVARILIKRQERADGAQSPRVASWRNDVVAVALGTALYGVFGAFLHAILIGVPAFRM